VKPVMPETADAPDKPENWVWLARIRRPQGRRGEVFAEILTDFPEKFAERRQLWLVHDSVAGERARISSRTASSLSPQSVQLKNHWPHKGGVVLHFAGVETISDAEKLAGLIVAIPREQRAALTEDVVYIADLVGCTLVDVANPDAPVLVGDIEDVERDAGPVPILMVRGKKGEVLIPFAKDYLRRIDLEGKRVEMALPEGLVDLNA
jgi:16S rRNA processing protein RimM